MRSLTAALIFSIGLGFAAPAVADAATERAATDLVRTLVTDAHAAGDNNAALTEAITGAFDFDVWARFLLGDGAGFTEDERTAFRTLLPGYLAGLYRSTFGTSLAEAPAVGDARPARRDVMVSAAFPREGTAGPLPVDWRIRETPEGPRVIDVMVGGTSFLLTRRDEFQSLIAAEGPAALIAHMQARSL